ncbi:MAG: hypothetical protein KDH20_08445 [Rhodocyclaceae bacterium]|nr:hypothetical protein [Rhodocyclaceae bacterium]
MPTKFPRNQRGTVLIVALVMLIAIMLLGLNSIRGTSLQVRMGSGIYDRQIAFQAAESAMREAEVAVGPGTNPVFDGSAGLYPIPAPVADGTYVDRWSVAGTGWVSGTAIANGPRTPTPQYIVEDLGEWPDPPDCLRQIPRDPLCLSSRYRITARSNSAGNANQVVIQSTFRPQ